MKNFSLKSICFYCGLLASQFPAIAAEIAQKDNVETKRETASTENDVHINLAKRRNGKLLVGEFEDRSRQRVRLEIQRTVIGEPVSTPIQIDAKVKLPDRSEPVKIVSELKVCEFDGAVYNPDDHAVYFLLREMNVEEKCVDKFSLKFPL